jgi:hypothetical protein
MIEFQIGDLVYIRDEVRINGILVSTNPPVMKFRIGTAGRIEYIDNNIASIRMEYDGERILVNVMWLGHWKDFATIKEVEDYLDD